MATDRNFVGHGWRFPFAFDERTGGVAKDEGTGVNQELDRVRSAIQQILGVRKGEMFAVRAFGSSIRDLIFAANDLTLAGLLDYAVRQALEDRDVGEHRVFISAVQVTTFPNDRSVVDFRVKFVMRSSNVEGNLVFPLYLTDNERSAAERSIRN